MSSSVLLKVVGLTVRYGAIEALTDASFEIEQGQTVALIGANGAGKSTTLKAISGLVKPVSGGVWLRGESLLKLRPDLRLKKGIAHSPEGRQVLTGLSVEDNLLLGAYIRKDKQGVQADLKSMYDLFPRLYERRAQLAGTLSGGEQQMLALARAVLSRPALLMLDEPSLGLAPLVVKEIFSTLERFKAQGLAILLVEQNAHLALTHAHQGVVLETGRVIAQGEGTALLEDERVQRAYLG